MASQAADNLIMIDMIPALIDPLWNTSAVLSESSMMGEVLHVMMGYSDQPSGMQVLVFSIALILMSILNQRLRYSVSRPVLQESPASL
jgi:high-affinity iron transporter